MKRCKSSHGRTETLKCNVDKSPARNCLHTRRPRLLAPPTHIFATPPAEQSQSVPGVRLGRYPNKWVIARIENQTEYEKDEECAI